MESSSQTDEATIMQGWLYLIRSNTFGFKYSRKLYFLLHNHQFKSFRSIPHSYNKVLFVFTLCDTSNCDAHVKLGASNFEEAATWVKSLQELCLKVKKNPGNYLDCLRSNYSGRVFHRTDVDDIISLTRAANIYEPSYWTIFGCHHGLRPFKQTIFEEGRNKRDGHPALAAVGVIDAAPKVIFQTLMSLGFSRSQWDFCFQKGSVIENIDGHTDIIHMQFNGDWLPWYMKQRDLLMQRFWRREDNGTYIILYHSVFHNKCPPQKGFIRAFLRCGGYVISVGSPFIKYVTFVSLTSTVMNQNALREHFNTNIADCLLSEFSSQELKKEILLQKKENLHSNFVRTDDDSDEFFDFPDSSFDDGSEYSWAGDEYQDAHVKAEKKHELRAVQPVLSPTEPAELESRTKLVCDFTSDTRSTYAAMQINGLQDSETIVWNQCVSYNYTITLPEDQTGNLPHSWSTPEFSSFQIRGKTFLDDHKKISAESALLQTIAVDWLKSDKREDHLANRPGNIVQKYAADGRPEFFVVINFQVPGSPNHNLAFYFTTRTPIKDIPLLERFIQGDDAFRNSRLKIIPRVTKGPWILRNTIRRPVLIGNMIKINYIHGQNYLEMDVDVGSSACARGVAGKTFSCFSNLIIDAGFVIQATTRDELPEHLLGVCRVSHLDVSKAILIDS